MFAIIRHAGYSLSSGSLTIEGETDAVALAQKLLDINEEWQEIRTSPTTRTRETAAIIGSTLQKPVEIDGRLNTDGNLTDLLPPYEPINIAFISHLPIITYLLRAWSKVFGIEEPPLTNVACGYLIIPDDKKIIPLKPRE
ncbi:MAG: phosphoglycerate mutase family protein [Patescibacteria group bacterium]